MEFWDQKDPVLKGLVPKKVVLVLVDEEKYPKRIVFNTQKVKKSGSKRHHTCITNIVHVPPKRGNMEPLIKHINSSYFGCFFCMHITYELYFDIDVALHLNSVIYHISWCCKVGPGRVQSPGPVFVQPGRGQSRGAKTWQFEPHVRNISPCILVQRFECL